MSVTQRWSAPFRARLAESTEIDEPGTATGLGGGDGVATTVEVEGAVAGSRPSP